MDNDTAPFTTNEVRCQRLVIQDEAGQRRIVADAQGDAATLRLYLSGRDDEASFLDLYTANDPDMGATLGVDITVMGTSVVRLHAYQDIGEDDTLHWRTSIDANK